MESGGMISSAANKQPPETARYYTDDPDANASRSVSNETASPVELLNESAPRRIPYRVYKRRFFGLGQLILLNIVVSWCWLTYASVSTTASKYFNVSLSAINWLSTAFLFAFVAASPVTIYVLNKRGPKAAIVVSGALIFLGSWIRYGGARSRSMRGENKFAIVMLGQILVGFGQPFVLSAPTRYSDIWFSDKGRIAATAVTSLANPLGGALGQLIDPLWATQPNDVPNMTLYVAILATIAALPSFLVPRAPPTPPTPVSKINSHTLNSFTVSRLARNSSFWVLFIPFALLVACFNAISSELNSILYPYNFSEDMAGLTGALLILAGLVAAAVSSPLVDAYTSPSSPMRLHLIKALVVIVAIAYLAFIWAPGTRGVGAPYSIAAIMGAASFMLVPLALELVVEVTWDVAGPELSSTLCWAGGQVGGAIGIIVMDSLRGDWEQGEPAGNMKAGLVFLAVVAWLSVPLPMLLGFGGVGFARRSAAAARRQEGEVG